MLPLGIVFFGLTYFLIADAIARQPFVQDDVEAFVADHGSSHTPVASWTAIAAATACRPQSSTSQSCQARTRPE